jgi:hypothetical protein
MRECPNCGARVPDEDVFCGECGARVHDGLAASPGEADVAVADEAPGEASQPRRKFSRLFVVTGCAAGLVVLVACGILAFVLANRSQPAGESVSLGGLLLPTATTAPRASAPASAPIFEEAFDDNTQEWSVWKDEQGEKGVEDGVYYITVDETEWASWGTSDGLTFADGVVEVEARAVDGPDDNGYGLVFRYQDNDNFYYFEVSSDGYYSIGKMVADEWESLVGWTESDVIRLGRQTNTLRVECDGSRMTFFVNDYQVEALTDYDFDAGSVGFVAETTEESGVRAHFDNLKVWATE